MRRKPKSNLKNGRCKKRKQGRDKEGRVLKLSTNKSNKGVDVLSRRAHRGSRSGMGGGCARGEAELASRSTKFVSWCWVSDANVQSGLEFPCTHDHRRRSAGLAAHPHIIPLLIHERSADHTADRPRCRLLGLPGAQHPPVAAATVRIPAPPLQRLAPGMLRSPKMCAPL